MIYLLKNALKLFLELVFDSKEEYDIRSAKFNYKKSLTFILLTVLFSLLLFTTNMLINVNNTFTHYKNVVKAYCITGNMPLPLCGKKPPEAPSNEDIKQLSPKNGPKT